MLDIATAVAVRKGIRSRPVEAVLSSGETLTMWRKRWDSDLEREYDALTPEKRESLIHWRARQLQAILEDWDLGENGEPLPVTVENILRFESNDVTAMHEAIARDLYRRPLPSPDSAPGTS